MIGLPWAWQVWAAWWQATSQVHTAAPDRTGANRPSPASCPACGQMMDESAVPDGYEEPHCLPCAQAIDRRAIARQTGGGACV